MSSGGCSGEPRGGAAGGRRGRLGREALARLPVDPGLCAECAHLEVQASRRSAFARCGLSDRDPRFPRYPRLPVLACAGFSRRPPVERRRSE